jgi:hypothetical protein
MFAALATSMAAKLRAGATGPIANLVLAGSGLAGLGLAWLLAQLREQWWVAGLGILFAWAAEFVLATYLSIDPGAHPLLILAASAMFIALLLASQVLGANWFTRRAHQNAPPPLFLFAVFALGCMFGMLAHPTLQIEFGTQYMLAHVGLAALGLLYGIFFLMLTRIKYDVAESSRRTDLQSVHPCTQGETDGLQIRPTGLRRLRWALLGALPACITIGLVQYVAAEIVPLPFLSSAAWMIYAAAWVAALARNADAPRMASMMVQGVVAIVPLFLAMILWPIEIVTMALVLGLIVLLVPHRFALAAQSSVLAVAFLQIFANLPFTGESQGGTCAMIGVQVLVCALTCWGCHGDAAKDAPPDKHMPEFLFFVLGGAMVGAALYVVLPPILSPARMIEYPIALGAALVVRALPWPWPRTQPGGTPERTREGVRNPREMHARRKKTASMPVPGAEQCHPRGSEYLTPGLWLDI